MSNQVGKPLMNHWVPSGTPFSDILQEEVGAGKAAGIKDTGGYSRG
jgi:hypothetical protein